MRRYILVALAVMTCLALGGNAGATGIIDLTTSGASGVQAAAVGGTFIVTQISPQSTGTGVIDSFLRVEATGNANFEQGFNTSIGTPLDDKGGVFTRALLLSDVPVVTIGGVQYREFLLDINQTNANSLLSLNQIQIFQSPADDATFSLTAATATTAPLISGLGTEVFRMSNIANPEWTIKMDYALNPGSGAGDMFLFVRNSLFNPAVSNVILYSEFGSPNGAYVTNDGFEEWAVLKGTVPPPPPVPEPASLLLLGSGLVGLAARFRRRR